MNLELFIAKRITNKGNRENRISSPIIGIAKISIALGICVMILSVAIVTGFKSEITQKVTGFASHIRITNYDNNNSYELQPINKELIDTTNLYRLDNVKHVQVFASKPGILKTDSDMQGVVLNGVGKDFDWQFFKQYLIAGKLLQITEKKSNDIIISEKLSKLLKLKVGDKIMVYFIQQPPRQRRFTVSGIYNTGMEEFDKLFLVCDIRHIQKLNNWKSNEIGGYEIVLHNFKDLSVTEDQIKTMTAGTFTADGSSLKVKGIDKKYPQIFTWLDMLDVNTLVILILMILVAGINMISGLLIIILERTNTIGILKALGTSNWSVRKLFLYQAAFIIGKGLLWGNIVGISFCVIQSYFKVIPLDPVNYYVDTVPININWVYILLLNIGSAIITFAMLLIPSYLITKISPVKAIRFE